MNAYLDSRVIRIARWLVEQESVRSTGELASDLGLSQRVIRYRLPAVENYLAEWGAELHRQRGSGLVVRVDDTVRGSIIEDLSSRFEAPRVYSPQERSSMLTAALLWRAPEIASLDEIHEELGVSKTSARRDLQTCEPWLERNGLPLVRRPGKGIAVVGSERRIRQVMVQLLLETIPDSVLMAQVGDDEGDREQKSARIPVGFRERLEALPLRESAAIIRESLFRQRLSAGRSELVFSLYLALSIARIREGRVVDVSAGLQRSVTEHPVAESVAGLVEAIEQELGGPFEEAEFGALTEYLLGLDTLQTTVAASGAIGKGMVAKLLVVAGDRLHPALVDDAELERGLAAHLERLSIRLRHGLPVHNPLLREVKERYPDVHVVAGELAALLEPQLGQSVTDDEIGFLTMYLSGAMERARLRPRRRVLVVCPSGMATAWVLVSRIQAEFPEFDLVQVLSEGDYEELDDRNYDLVITTVPVPEHSAPVVVVNPLLSAGDVARVNAAAH